MIYGTYAKSEPICSKLRIVHRESKEMPISKFQEGRLKTRAVHIYWDYIQILTDIAQNLEGLSQNFLKI